LVLKLVTLSKNGLDSSNEMNQIGKDCSKGTHALPLIIPPLFLKPFTV